MVFRPRDLPIGKRPYIEIEVVTLTQLAGYSGSRVPASQGETLFLYSGTIPCFALPKSDLTGWNIYPLLLTKGTQADGSIIVAKASEASGVEVRLHELRNLLDVNVAALGDGKYPVWNAASSKFIFATPPSPGAITIDYTKVYLYADWSTALSEDPIVWDTIDIDILAGINLGVDGSKFTNNSGVSHTYEVTVNLGVQLFSVTAFTGNTANININITKNGAGRFCKWVMMKNTASDAEENTHSVCYTFIINLDATDYFQTTVTTPTLGVDSITLPGAVGDFYGAPYSWMNVKLIR